MANKFSNNRVYTIDDIRKEKLGDNYITYADREKELKATEEKERLAREQAERDKARAKAEQDQRLLDSISQPTNPLDRIRGIADMAGFKMMDAQKEEPLVSRPIQQTTSGAIAPSSSYQSIKDIPQYEQNFGQGAIGVDSATMKRMEADELKRQSKDKEAFEKSGATNFSRFMKGVEKQRDVGTSFMDYATEGALEAGRGIINTLYNVSRENLQGLEEQRYEKLKKYMPDMKEPEPLETKDLLKKTSRQMGIEAQRQSEREQMGKFRGFVEDVKQGGASMVFPLLISGATGGLSSSSLLSPSTQSKITSGLSKVFGSKMSTGLVNRITGVLSKKGLASSAAIGGQSGGQAAQRALDQGATGSEALTTGTLVGGAEALTEQLFGLVPGLDNLGNKLDSLTGNRKADAFKIVAGLLKNSLEEGGEEVIMGIVEPLITDKVYGSGDKIDLKEVGYQGLIGFILGGIMAGGQAVGQVSESRDIARQEQQGVLERFNLQNNEVVKEMQNVGELVFGTLDSNERMQLLDNASNNLDQIIGLYNDIAIGNKPIDGVDVNKTNASKIAIELNIIKGILDNKRIETQRELMLKLPAQGETTQTIEGQLQAKADSMPSMQDMTAQPKSPFDLPQQTVPMTNNPLSTINELKGKPNVNLPMMEGELVPQVKADRQEITTQQQPQAEPTKRQEQQPQQSKEERWTKTKSEYVGTTSGATKELLEYEHRQAVDKAIKEGKPVPREVLEDYTDLVWLAQQRPRPIATQPQQQPQAQAEPTKQGEQHPTEIEEQTQTNIDEETKNDLVENVVDFKPARFKRQDIEIKAREGKKKVSAMVYKGVGLHKDSKMKTSHVVHVNSGVLIKTFDNEKQAKLFAQVLADTVDTNMTIDEFVGIYKDDDFKQFVQVLYDWAKDEAEKGKITNQQRIEGNLRNVGESMTPEEFINRAIMQGDKVSGFTKRMRTQILNELVKGIVNKSETSININVEDDGELTIVNTPEAIARVLNLLKVKLPQDIKPPSYKKGDKENVIVKDINKIKEVADKRIENNIQKAAKKPSSLLTQETSEYAEKLKWDKNFPKLINMTNLPALKNKKNGNLKLHEKAKTGDVEAAYELVKNLYKEERIIEIGKNYPNAILVPVHAEESTGENAIPVVYADRISILTGLEVDDNIVQTNRAKRTEKTKQQRLFQKVTFYGEVKAGRDYIIVDDVVTQGGTIRGLKEHIIKNGGNVVAITALAPGQARPTQISITEGTIDALKRRFGYDELTNAIKEFGVAKSIEELTEAEGRDIYSGFGDVKSFRDTATKEKQERNAKEGKRALREREVLKAAKKTKPLMETKKIKGPSDKKGIVRRSDIEEFLSKNLDIPIRQGKFSQKAYGIFKVKPEVIRLRKTKDIETLFHEVGHFFDKKYRLSNPSFDKELIDLGKETSLPSYTKEQVRKEGVAEFFRYFIIRPDLAKQKAPRFYDYFTTKTSDNPDLKVMFDYLKTAVKDYQNQSATNKVLSNVAVDRKVNKFNIKEFFNKMLTMFDDELGEIDRAVKKMIGNIKLPASKDPYKLAYLYKGWAGKAETYLEYGIVNRKGKKTSKGLKEILEPVADDLDGLRAYLVAKRVIELKDRNIESGITLEDANEAIREQSGKGFDKVAKELVEYQNMIAQQLVNAGIISQDKFDSMKKLNQNYVPFYRVMDDDVKRGHGRGMQSYNPIHNIKGSTRDIIDPLTSIIKNTYLLTDISERNYVGKALVDIANEYDGTGKFLDKVPSSMIPRSFTLSEIKNVLDGAGADLETIDLENIATIFRPASPKGNVLTVYKNGKPQYYEIFDKELYKAMMSLNSESTDTFIKMLSIPARMLRAGAVTTLDFAARNPLRDTLTAAIYNEHGFIPLLDTIKGIFNVSKKDEAYYEFMSSGAMGSMIQSIDHAYSNETLEELIGKGFRRQYINPLHWIGKFGETTEKGTRIGVMERGKGKAEREELAFSARRTTIDFLRLGSAMKNINKVVPFSGAQEEGVSRFIREFTPRRGANGKLDFSRPLSLLIRCLLLITLPSMALFFKNKDNPYYQELPQWRKDLFWNIPIDGAPFNFIMLPKPFLEGVIFGAVPERAIQYLYSKDKKAFDGLEDAFRDATLPDFIPTALKPIIENITNYSFFGQRNIVPQSEEKLEPYMQYGKYTSETAKALGRVFNYSPRKIDNLFRGYGGGLARYVTDTIDKGLAITGTIDEDVFPRDVKKYPIARSFMSTALTTYTQSIEDFYNELNSMEREYSTMKAKDEIGGLDQYHRAEELRKYRKLNSYLSEKRTQIYDMQDAKVPDATINEEIVKMLNLVREERGMLQLDTDIKYGDLENKYLYDSTRQDILNQAEKLEKIPKHLIDEALESAGFSRQKLNEATEKLKAENYELAMRYLRDAEIPLDEKVNLIKQIDKANNKLDANKIINDLFK